MFRRCIALVCFVLIAAGAGLAPAQNPEPGETYFPLEVGAVWHYKAGENRFQVKVAKFEDVDKVKTARLELIVNNKVQAHENVAVTKNGVVRYSFDGKKASPVLFLKLPIKANETWKVESKVDGKPLKGEFKSGTDDKVSVVAGNFKTITVKGIDIEADGVKLGLTYYFAEKVGMVKQVIEIAGRKVVIELEKYEPARKKKDPDKKKDSGKKKPDKDD